MNKIYSLKIKIIALFLIFTIFFVGILFERLKINHKFSKFFLSFTESIGRTLYNPELSKDISLEIKPKDYETILKVRKKSLKQNILTKNLEKWVSGILISENISHKIELRLKGIFSDHWSDLNQLSFKVKVKNDSMPIYGQRRFALQAPSTTSYLYEWLFMKALEKEKLLSLGITFVNMKINDNNKGVYALIGQASDVFLKKNNRQSGPIIGFDSELWVKEQIQSTMLDAKKVIRPVNSNEDSFWRASITPIQFSEEKSKNEINRADLKKAIFLLESFRNGSLKTSEVFDVNQLTKVMALRALAGSSEFDWLDTKFYYNKNTGLLEPISKEIHVDLTRDYKKNYRTWWIDSSKVRDHYFKNTDFFIDTLYKDKNFYEKYLIELNNLSKKKYYSGIINENKKDFEKYKKILSISYPKKKIFSKEQLEITRNRIRDFVDPIQGINTYFKNYENGVLSLNILNLQRLPIKIKALKLNNGKIINLNKEILIDGQKPHVAIEEKLIKINCNFLESCEESKIKDQMIVYNILGQEKAKQVAIIPYYY